MPDHPVFTRAKNKFPLWDYYNFAVSPSWKGIIKQTKATAFYDHSENASQNILVFLGLSLFHSLYSVTHAPYSTAVEKLRNSLLLLASFLTKNRAFFYSLISFVTLRNEEIRNTKNTNRKKIVKLINY